MARFVSRSFAVEAVQLLPKLVPPDWMDKAEADGILTFENDGDLYLSLKTQGGKTIRVDVGDWLICSATGISQCDPNVFLQTFTLA